MTTPTPAPQPERAQTDKGLKSERTNTDRALAQRRSHDAQKADAVVERARDAADAVLDRAREHADDAVRNTPFERRTLQKERATADLVLQEERDAADEHLRRERAAEADTLRRLLPLERERTDRYLLTERVRADDALSHRDDFLGMVAHDLKSLLGGILLNATAMSQRVPSSGTERRSSDRVDRIQRYVARMNRLIGDLVDVASIDAGKLAVRAAPSSANELVAQAVDAFALAASEKGIVLQSEPGAASIVAPFDHERLMQVLANLITNALKFTARGGRVVVRAETVGDELRLSVSDTGAGIPAETLGSVFERFWQAGDDDRRGLGLGLYISRCIVDAHGGRIWAESVPGVGSTFTVALPLAPRPSPSPVQSAARGG